MMLRQRTTIKPGELRNEKSIDVITGYLSEGDTRSSATLGKGLYLRGERWGGEHEWNE